MDSRAKSELHEAVTRLIWNRSFREDYRGSWDEARELKHITGAYRSTTAAYLTASDVLDLVEAHAAKSAGQAAGERRLMTLLEGKREDLFEPGRGGLKYRLGDDGLAYIHLTNREAREILSAKPAPNSTRTGAAETEENWRADPSADERWCAGVDYAQEQLCHVLGVDPSDVNWDAATETLDGDMQAVICTILAAWGGDDWQALAARPEAPSDAGWRERVRHVKRGTEYEVLGEAEAQVSKGESNRFGEWRALYERDKLTVYRGSDGKLWCRFPDEMRDGRFETITPPSDPAPSGQAEG